MPYTPAEPIPPGEILKDEIEARNWTQEDLAAVLGVTPRQVFNLLSGKSGLTPSMANLIAEAFDQDAKDWMNFQISYELASLAQKDRQVKKRAAVYAKVPVRELIRRGWLGEEKDADALADAVCRFLRIKHIDASPVVSWAARKSDSYCRDSAAQIAWYFRAKQLAECTSVKKQYKDSEFDKALESLHSLAGHVADVRRIPKVLADFGIRFVIVERLKQSKVDGACFWLDECSPVVAVSIRYDRIDNFWFTLMHEMAHVKFRDESVDVEIMESDDDLPEYEKRANEHAAEFLIPQKKLESFVLRNNPLFYKKRIVEFANSRGVHPGIVVGQLHWKRKIKYSRLRQFLEKIKDEIVGHALTDGWGDYPVIGD